MDQFYPSAMLRELNKVILKEKNMFFYQNLDYLKSYIWYYENNNSLRTNPLFSRLILLYFQEY